MSRDRRGTDKTGSKIPSITNSRSTVSLASVSNVPAAFVAMQVNHPACSENAEVMVRVYSSFSSQDSSYVTSSPSGRRPFNLQATKTREKLLSKHRLETRGGGRGGRARSTHARSTRSMYHQDGAFDWLNCIMNEIHELRELFLMLARKLAIIDGVIITSLFV